MKERERMLVCGVGTGLWIVEAIEEPHSDPYLAPG